MKVEVDHCQVGSDVQRGDLRLRALEERNYVTLARSVNREGLSITALVVNTTEAQLANWGQSLAGEG